MKRKWRWVTRDKGSLVVRVWYSAKKPTERAGGLWHKTGAYDSDYAKDFATKWSIDVPDNSCIKVEFTAKVIE